MPLRQRLETYFEFTELDADWRTEILAGLTTFMTMAYIVFVNPAILHEAGMPLAAVTAATCLSAAVGSFLMGALARYPIALAPGMGLNAYFTYTVVKGMGVPWQAALGAVFLSGVAFLLLTLVGVRQLIISAIPHELHSAVAAGVGLFIAFIGFRNSGIVVPDPATLVTLGKLGDKSTALAVFGLLLIAALLAWRVRAAMLIGILTTTVVGLLTGVAKWSPQFYTWSGLSATAGKLDVAATLRIGFLEIVFVFLFIDVFDNIGTLLAVGKKAGLFDKAHRIPRVNRILLADATATIAGSLAGTSTVVSYIESAAGVAAGGRTGVTAIVTGALFAIALFVAPVVGAIPAAATAPALIVVGSLMMSSVAEVEWSDPEVGVPAFLTMMAIPLTYSIANGLAFGFTAYTLMKLLRGKFRQVSFVVYMLTAIFILRFVYLARGA
ncbi:MAG TPA: NCS2 family permease [Bryobacteraceae bacterium]|jgi:AGZA family xanthine/uracil permease-like MFS transporter|nr:NCS2 family permease [Bryobacteraceae bacterium]